MSNNNMRGRTLKFIEIPQKRLITKIAVVVVVVVAVVEIYRLRN